jgi:hypothetical protein
VAIHEKYVTKLLMMEQTVELLFDLRVITAEFMFSAPMPISPYKYQVVAKDNWPSSSGHVYLWFI